MKTKITFLFLTLFTFSVNTEAQLTNKKFEIKLGEMGTFYIQFEASTFKLFNSMGELGVTGTYKIESDTIQFTDNGGPIACQKENVGKYKFKLQNDEFKMELIEDKCPGRPKMAAVTWRLVDK